jgi:hypothetical protein
MPTLSINKNDLADLGISLKDILLAITKSKQSGSDVIKIKKKRKQYKKKPKGIAKQPRQPKYSSPAGGGGGGGASIYNPSPAPIITNITMKGTTDEDNQKNLAEEQKSYIKNQIEDLKKDSEAKMITQQNQLADFQSMNHLGMRLIYNKLENPLSNISAKNFREPPAVDRGDRFGIIPQSNFYDDTVRIEFADDEAQSPDPVSAESIPTTEALPVSEPFETALEQEVQKEQKKKAGRPKGSKNKPKQPLTQDAIAEDMALPNTRSSLADLINPEMATPDRYAREQMKKQEEISKYFTPRRVAERKPIAVIPEDDEEEPIFDMNTRAPPPRVPPTTSGIVPTPPTTEKPSKFKSRLPTRAKSDSMVFG